MLYVIQSCSGACGPEKDSWLNLVQTKLFVKGRCHYPLSRCVTYKISAILHHITVPHAQSYVHWEHGSVMIWIYW